MRHHIMDDTTPPERRSDADTPSDTMPTFSTAEVAALLGVTTDTVRARIRRGVLSGMKVDGVWRVQLPDDLSLESATNEDQQEGTPEPAVRRVTDGAWQDTMPQDIPGTMPVDLALLAAVIDDQMRRISELSAEAAMWQTRALQVEAQLNQITAGSGRPADVQELDTQGDVVRHAVHDFGRVLRDVFAWSAQLVLAGILLLVLVRFVNRRGSWRRSGALTALTLQSSR